MDYTRNLLVSAPVAVVLMVLFFLAVSSPTTIQVQNVQAPLSATERGLPLPFEYVYNCVLPAQTAYCSTATPPIRTATLANPSRLDFTNAAIDYLFWFAISLLMVTMVDALTQKRFVEQAKEEGTISPGASAGTT